MAIAYTPIMLRLLGKNEYGLYNLAGSIVSYLSLFSFGFSAAYMRFYARCKAVEDDEGVAKLNGLFLLVYTVFSILVLVSGAVLVVYSDSIVGSKFTVEELQTVKVLMAILVGSMAFTFVTPVFDSYIVAHEKFIFQKSLQIVGQVCSPLICLPVLLMGYKSIGLVIAMTVVSLGVKLINIAYSFRVLRIKFIFRNLDFMLLKEVSVFSFFIFLNMIIDQVNWNVDKFLIGRFRGPAEVAEYGLAAQLNTIYLSISVAISSVFVPSVNMLISQKKSMSELSTLFTRIGRLQFIILSLGCGLLICFGREFIMVWAGKNYVNSYFVALLLILPVTIPLIQNLAIEIQKAQNMHHFRSIIYFIIAVINIAISIPLVRAYGAVGAAAGTALALIAGNVIIMNIFYHKVIKLNMVLFWKEIVKFLPALILPVICGYSLMTFVDLTDLLNFILGTFVFAVVFTFSFWVLGMNSYEKDLIRVPLYHLRDKLFGKGNQV